MTTILTDSLPEPFRSIRTRSLFAMRLQVQKPQIIGDTPGASRRIGVVLGGSFEGDLLSGEVLEGAATAISTVRIEKGEHPKAHFATFSGTLHADGYEASKINEPARIQEAACWAYVRRKFFDLTAASAGTHPIAEETLIRIGGLRSSR